MDPRWELRSINPPEGEQGNEPKFPWHICAEIPALFPGLWDDSLYSTKLLPLWCKASDPAVVPLHALKPSQPVFILLTTPLSHLSTWEVKLARLSEKRFYIFLIWCGHSRHLVAASMWQCHCFCTSQPLNKNTGRLNTRVAILWSSNSGGKDGV